MAVQNHEQEVNLRDYLNVIVKRGKLIAVIFLVSVSVTAFLNIIAPRVWEVSMVIEPNILGISDSGNYVFVDSPTNIRTKIEMGTYDVSVANALKNDPRIFRVKVKAYQPKDSTVIKCTINEPDKDKDVGIKVLKQLFAEINNNYNLVESKKKGEIIFDKSKYLSGESSGIRNVNMIQEPSVSLDPIGPKRTQNVIFSGVLSLMLGIFLAFFMEYWERTNNKR